MLWCFRWIEKLLPKERAASLTLFLDPKSRLEDEIHSYLTGFDVRIVSWAARARTPSGERTNAAAKKSNSGLPQFVGELARRSDVVALDWNDFSQGGSSADET